MEKPLTDFDKRIVSRSIRKGVLTSEEVRNYYDNLPDLSENAEPLSLEESDEKKPAEATGTDVPPEGEASPPSDEAEPSSPEEQSGGLVDSSGEGT